MFYQLVPAPRAELVLCVSQGARSSKLDRRHGEPRLRASNRRLSRAAMRIERTSEYQLSLSRVLELGQRFQAQLQPSQQGQWLELEDALLEHTSRLNQAYFQAGTELGRQQSRKRESRKREFRKREFRKREPGEGGSAKREATKRALEERGSPQSARLRPQSHRVIAHYRKVAAERGRDAEIISGLAELIRKLAQR
jgi:hypothetical protein